MRIRTGILALVAVAALALAASTATAAEPEVRVLRTSPNADSISIARPDTPSVQTTRYESVALTTRGIAMSWSKSASGDVASIREQVSHWPEQIQREDAGSTYLTDAAKQGHQTQVDVAVKTVDHIAAIYPQTLMGIVANGHASENGAGNVNVSYSLIKAEATQ